MRLQSGFLKDNLFGSTQQSAFSTQPLTILLTLENKRAQGSVAVAAPKTLPLTHGTPGQVTLITLMNADELGKFWSPRRQLRL